MLGGKINNYKQKRAYMQQCTQLAGVSPVGGGIFCGGQKNEKNNKYMAMETPKINEKHPKSHLGESPKQIQKPEEPDDNKSEQREGARKERSCTETSWSGGAGQEPGRDRKKSREGQHEGAKNATNSMGEGR